MPLLSLGGAPAMTAMLREGRAMGRKSPCSSRLGLWSVPRAISPTQLSQRKKIPSLQQETHPFRHHPPLLQCPCHPPASFLAPTTPRHSYPSFAALSWWCPAREQCAALHPLLRGSVSSRNICKNIWIYPAAITCSPNRTPANYFPRARWCRRKALATDTEARRRARPQKWPDFPWLSSGIRNKAPRQLISDYFV